LHRYVLHSVFLSGELLPDFYFSKGQLPLKWEKEGLNHLKLLENWFFVEGIITFISTGYSLRVP
jgi:hypothetical protein